MHILIEDGIASPGLVVRVAVYIPQQGKISAKRA